MLLFFHYTRLNAERIVPTAPDRFPIHSYRRLFTGSSEATRVAW
jgi:hypothetical protein